MRARSLLIASILLGTLARFAVAQETTSPLVQQLYDGKWPDKQTVEQLNKERLYMRALQAYMATLPLLNTIGRRDGSEAKFGKGYNVLSHLEGLHERHGISYYLCNAHRGCAFADRLEHVCATERAMGAAQVGLNAGILPDRSGMQIRR
jgi:hypothetical protein